MCSKMSAIFDLQQFCTLILKHLILSIVKDWLGTGFTLHSNGARDHGEHPNSIS
jgi:hypothetical protein